MANFFNLIGQAFQGHTLSCIEIQAITIGWCAMVIGVIGYGLWKKANRRVQRNRSQRG